MYIPRIESDIKKKNKVLPLRNNRLKVTILKVIVIQNFLNFKYTLIEFQ